MKNLPHFFLGNKPLSAALTPLLCRHWLYAYRYQAVEGEGLCCHARVPAQQNREKKGSTCNTSEQAFSTVARRRGTETRNECPWPLTCLRRLEEGNAVQLRVSAHACNVSCDGIRLEDRALSEDRERRWGMWCYYLKLVKSLARIEPAGQKKCVLRLRRSPRN